MSVRNRNMKHARAIEFDLTNLLAMLIIVICASNCVVEVLTSVIFECLRFLIHLTGNVIDWFFLLLSFLGRITSSLDGVRINI